MSIATKIYEKSRLFTENQFTTLLALILIMMGVYNVVFAIGGGIDDALITFRYAHNLVNFGIWNYNPDHDLVEAYTNFSYAILAIIPEYFKTSPLFFFKIFAFFIQILFILRILQYSPNKLAAIAALVFLGINPYFYKHLYSGLETPFFMFLIFELAMILTQKKQNQEKYLTLIFLLLPWTRPEGIIFSMVGSILYWTTFPYEKNKFLITFSWIPVFAVYLLMKTAYFGYLLPNTYYVKTGQTFNINDFHINLTRMQGYIITLSLLFIVIPQRTYRWLLLSALIVIGGVYLKSILYMNYADRFAFQFAIPLILVGICLSEFNIKAALSLLFFTIYFIITINVYEFNYYFTSYFKKPTTYRYSLTDVGLMLSNYKQYHYSILLGDVGALPYYAGWKTYDYIGLADKYLAHHGMVIDDTYLKLIDPDLVMLYGDEHGIFEYQFQQDKIQDYVTRSNKYQLIVSQDKHPGFHYIYYLKKTNPHFSELKKLLEEADNLRSIPLK